MLAAAEDSAGAASAGGPPRPDGEFAVDFENTTLPRQPKGRRNAINAADLADAEITIPAIHIANG